MAAQVEVVEVVVAVVVVVVFRTEGMRPVHPMPMPTPKPTREERTAACSQTGARAMG